jgi:preprotein translocase subunit SecD
MLNKYPLWKNLLLIAMILLGLLYALPNIYGDDPSVQISPPAGTKVDNNLMSQVSTVLQTNNLRSKSIEISNQNQLLVRFYDADTELKAKDDIKAALGDDYTVAINIAPATPKWLEAIGAHPMKLGLDLRGGVHFAFQVDVNAVVNQRITGMVKNISDALRSADIRYAAVAQQQNQIMVGFRDADSEASAQTLLTRQFPELILVPHNAGDRYQLIGQWSPQGLNDLRQHAIDQTMTTLRNRVNELGVAEPVVQQQGPDRIAIDLPGIQDTARAEQILGGTATLEFRLQDMTHDPRAALGGMVPPGSVLYTNTYNNQPVLLQDQVILTGNSITDAQASFGEDGRASVNITLGGGGENYFHRVTGENIGKPLGIVFVETRMSTQIINGKPVNVPRKVEKVISNAIIQSALPSNFQITGLSNADESRNLALLLRAGALPAPIFMVESRTIGPQLGAENIHMGFISIVVGFILAVIFMAIYYRTFGLIANAALAMNLILLVAVLSLLGMTLTLPGMAGIVLTVGMAVDANVLIFERIREELRNGVTPQASIHAGYERAFSTIVDANVSTLIAALVLFGIGTGAVKGFAVTLSLGLLTSMLTGIVCSRALVNTFFGGRVVKKLPIGM